MNIKSQTKDRQSAAHIPTFILYVESSRQSLSGKTKYRLPFTMVRLKLGRTIVLGVFALNIWVAFTVIYRLPLTVVLRQKIIATQSFPNQVSIIQTTHDDSLETRSTNAKISEDTLRGLNVHTWEFGRCRITLEQLCNHPMFPKSPDTRHFVSNADINSAVDKNFGTLRLLGYLRPNVTGVYQFLVASNGLAEVWLSLSANWKDAKRIAYIESPSVETKLATGRQKSQISSPVSLVEGKKYDIEVIYVQGNLKKGERLIQVFWKQTHSSGFELIDKAFFSPYTNEIEKYRFEDYDDELPEASSCTQLPGRYANKYMRPETLSYLERAAVDKVLAVCDYRPSYVLDPEYLPLEFEKYHGVKRHVRKAYIYPALNITGVAFPVENEQMFVPEYPLNEKEAFSVVGKYFEALSRTFPRKYELQSIIRVEKKEDPEEGSRYLLDLRVRELPSGTSYILAEYVFQPKDRYKPLCYPRGLQWNRTADVYLILTAKNLGRWVHHFIKNVEEIVQETKDEHLHVVIFDFDSSDIDIEQALKRSTLTNYHFIIHPGNYSRTFSFSKAVESIKDPDAIIVTIDMHLDLGSRLINDIRKHCIKGKMVYAPQIVYLNCDGSSAVPKGRWYHYSYGTVAVYKQDWDKFGGFSKDFDKKVTWGGEDWDLIDGAVKSGLEIERKRSPSLYHYYHTKAGMWQKVKNATSTKLPMTKKPTNKKP